MPLTSEPCRPARTHGWTWIVPGKSTAHTTRPAPRAHSWAMTPYSPRGKATISEKPLSAIWFPSFLTYRARYQVPLTIIRGQRHGFNPTKDARPRRASRSRLRSRRCSRCLSEAMISSSTQWTVDQRFVSSGRALPPQKSKSQLSGSVMPTPKRTGGLSRFHL
jgi:hypothetical protein